MASVMRLQSPRRLGHTSLGSELYQWCPPSGLSNCYRTVCIPSSRRRPRPRARGSPATLLPLRSGPRQVVLFQGVFPTKHLQDEPCTARVRAHMLCMLYGRRSLIYSTQAARTSSRSAESISGRQGQGAGATRGRSTSRAPLISTKLQPRIARLMHTQLHVTATITFIDSVLNLCL